MRADISQATELFLRVDEVLHYVWDPIGVSGVPQARDEYTSYVAGIVALLDAGGSEESIAERLLEIASTRMELPRDEARARQAASAMVDWREFLRERSL